MDGVFRPGQYSKRATCPGSAELTGGGLGLGRVLQPGALLEQVSLLTLLTPAMTTKSEIASARRFGGQARSQDLFQLGNQRREVFGYGAPNDVVVQPVSSMCRNRT